MKKRKIIIYILISLFLIFIIGGYFFLRNYIPKYSWVENLNINNKEPYGASILYELVKGSVGKSQFIDANTGNFDMIFKDKHNASYFFVGTNYYIDSVNVASILNFARNGNKVFIASTFQMEDFINYWMNDSTMFPIDSMLLRDTISTQLNLPIVKGDSTFMFYHQYLKKTNEYEWNYFTDALLKPFRNDSSMRILSTIDGDKPNFIVIKLGEGSIYLHTNPIFLSNYHMLRSDTYEYLHFILNEVSSDVIIWDNYSYSPFKKFSTGYKESPLRFILKHKSFRWAWYLLLFSVILFVIVQSKRKQNVIQLIDKKENNMLDYTKAIGTLYFQSKNGSAIAVEMMSQLYGYIRTRYNIKIGKDKYFNKSELSKASGIEIHRLEELFQLESMLINSKTADSEELFQLYKLVNYFYSNSN